MCNVGDDTWWKAVPGDNLAQVIQQVAVLDFDYVLFCVATDKWLIMSCLVHVSEVQRINYTQSIAKWSHLMDWALDSLKDNGPPPSAPAAFSDMDRYILSTHLQLWRALRKKLSKMVDPSTLCTSSSVPHKCCTTKQREALMV